MTRVPARVAARIVGIRPTSLHRWVALGRLTRHPDGYDLAELLKAEAGRNEDALKARAGMKGHCPIPRDRSGRVA
jgi:hypothetical protein